MIIRVEDSATLEVTQDGKSISLEIYGAEHDNYGWTELTVKEAKDLIDALELAVEQAE